MRTRSLAFRSSFKETNNSFASPTTTILLNEKIVTLPYMMMTNDDKKQHKMIKKTSMLHLTLHTRIHIYYYMNIYNCDCENMINY